MTTQSQLVSIQALREKQAALVAALKPHRNLAALEDEERAIQADLERIRARRAQASAELDSATQLITERESKEAVVRKGAEALDGLDQAGLELGHNPSGFAFQCRQWLRELENARRDRVRLQSELKKLGEE